MACGAGEGGGLDPAIRLVSIWQAGYECRGRLEDVPANCLEQSGGIPGRPAGECALCPAGAADQVGVYVGNVAEEL